MSISTPEGTVTLSEALALPDSEPIPLVFQPVVVPRQTAGDILRTDAIRDLAASVRADQRRPRNVLHTLILGGEMSIPQIAASTAQPTATVREEVALLTEVGFASTSYDEARGTTTYHIDASLR